MNGLAVSNTSCIGFVCKKGEMCTWGLADSERGMECGVVTILCYIALALGREGDGMAVRDVEEYSTSSRVRVS